MANRDLASSAEDARRRANKAREDAQELEAAGYPNDASLRYAEDLDELAAEYDSESATEERESEGGGDSAPNNPADDIGEAAEAVEEATVETAEAAHDAGNDALADAIADRVMARMAAAQEQVSAAAEEVEEVAEAVEEATPPESEAGEEAEEAAEEAHEAVEESHEAEESIRDEVRPQAEHWWYRKLGRRN